MSGAPSRLRAYAAAVTRSAMNLRAYIEQLEELAPKRVTPPEVMALYRQHLDHLRGAERLLDSLVPHEEALRVWLKERTAATS